MIAPYFSSVTVNMAWVSKWHYPEPCMLILISVEDDPNRFTCASAQEREAVQGTLLLIRTALNTHALVIALKVWLSMQKLPMMKTTSVNICFGNWNWASNGTLTLFSVFVDQLELTDLHSRITLKALIATLLFLSFDSSVASLCLLALQKSKPPDLDNIFTSSHIHPLRFLFL